MRSSDKYNDLVRKIILAGERIKTRNGYALQLSNQTLKLNLSNNRFPIITSKKIFYKKGIAEFCWLMQGKKSIDYLLENNVSWWNAWADENNNLEYSYPEMLRKYNGNFDQLIYVINELRNNPNGMSRRAVISFWNPSLTEKQNLPCCYVDMTFVSAGKNLDMIMNFRSSDVFLGLPYDIIVGALMLKYIANATGHVSKNIFFNLANAHIYENHLNEVNEMLLLNTYPDPTLKVNKFSFNAEDYIIENYQSNKFIKAELNV
tara:strand:- start:2559 stop:3341 length:783 start_codon:yes stop_codon:yes gene_type:complete